MGDRWHLLLGERQILFGKNEFPSRLMTVFQEEDKYMQDDWAQGIDRLNRIPSGQEVPPELQVFEQWDDEKETLDRFGYRTSVATVLVRLKLMGFTPEASRRSMAEIHRSTLKEYGAAEDTLLVSPARGVQGEPHQMSSEQVVDTGLAAHIKACTRHGFDDEHLDLVEINCLKELDYYFEQDSDDPRFLLAALLQGQDPQNTLTMDLSDLLAADYCSSLEDLSAQAIRELSFLTANTGPVIVITEGKFDAQVIPRALRLVRPEIAGYFKFWEIEATKAAGGTDQVVKNMRSFAAAGVMNRVIGILDDDTAGRQAEKQLASTPLPDHYAVCRLPALDYAHAYPTQGPSGASIDDVAGRACSVEFYFGKNCLLGTDGKLVPVRWKSYNDSMSDYQGELANKPYVQERIKEMLRAAEAGETTLGSDWEPMRLLAERLVDLAQPDPE
ncbi:HEPN/Toprim-associated domain-containing protein [Streptomyces parvus]|uniref:HEPN/Toprim-associated domain-containing protein n=1 Tax=Streptomyces parvus TaxID=66428 RepID=UPI0033DE7EA5